MIDCEVILEEACNKVIEQGKYPTKAICSKSFYSQLVKEMSESISVRYSLPEGVTYKKFQAQSGLFELVMDEDQIDPVHLVLADG